MQVSSYLPSTNQPSPGDFMSAYEKARNEHNEVVSIHLSSGISGTVQSANLAVQMMGDKNIHVIDSLKASVGQGLMVLEAARLAHEGADVPVIKHAWKKCGDTCAVFL
jgi:DegV family protein with EDD domain